MSEFDSMFDFPWLEALRLGALLDIKRGLIKHAQQIYGSLDEE